MTTPQEEWEKEFVEKGANLEHARWAKWQKYLHSKCVEHENGKGEWVCFPAELFRRWERQINTPYSELSEQEKESDRKEVGSYLPLIRTLLTQERTRLKEEIEKIQPGIATWTMEDVSRYDLAIWEVYQYALSKINK